MNRLACAAVLAAATACSNDTAPRTDSTLVLTSVQANALAGRFTQIGTANPELSWLADSTNVVLRAGATVKKVSILVDDKPRSFYATGFQRAFIINNSFSTFHFIAFNNPSTVDTFVVINGYASNAGAAPPASVTGSFGTAAMFGHLIAITTGPADESVLTDWVADAGDGSMAASSSGQPCESLELLAGASCALADIGTLAFVTSAHSTTASGTHTLRVAAPVGMDFGPITVHGVVLTFTPQD